MKKTRQSANMQRRNRVLKIIGGAGLFLLSGILAGQAGMKMLKGDFSQGVNYYHQPVSPVIQMVCAIVGFIVGVVMVIRGIRQKGK